MATYPSGIISFATHNSGDIVQPGDVNTPNAEIVAVETGLLNGFQHNLLPDTDDTRSLGSTSKRWLKVWSQDLDADGTCTLVTVNISGTLTPASLVDISGAGAGQIKFPSSQDASANANTLDDYSEGSWTPSVGGSATYTTQLGTYTKIGNVVYVTCDMTINAIGSGSTGIISGLPYTSATGPAFAATVGFFNTAASSFTSLAGYIASATTSIRVTGLTAAGASVGDPAVVFQNSTHIIVSAVYRTA